jgi:hypothetical protein
MAFRYAPAVAACLLAAEVAWAASWPRRTRRQIVEGVPINSNSGRRYTSGGYTSSFASGSKPTPAPTVRIGEDIHVSTQGDDTTGDGTEFRPWKTIQKCIDYADAHDRCNLHNGRYPEPIFIDKLSPITISGQVGATAMIDGTAVIKTLWHRKKKPGPSPVALSLECLAETQGNAVGASQHTEMGG